MVEKNIWDSVLEQTKAAQEKGSDPFLWAIQLSSNLSAAGVNLPSSELAHSLVSYICWDNNVPAAWKFLEQALVINMVPPLLVIALLSTRVILCRHSYPTGYRLYMELLKRYAFTLKPQINAPNFQKIMMSIDQVLHLSQVYGLQAREARILLVEFVFTIVWQLLDASLDDEGLVDLTPERKSIWLTNAENMDVDTYENDNQKRFELLEKLRSGNTVMAVDVMSQFLKNDITSRILCLVRHNMPKQWAAFTQRLELLAANSSTLNNLKSISPKVLSHMTYDVQSDPSQEYNSSLEEFCGIMVSRSLASPSDHCPATSHSALWLPLDIVLEDTMDGYQVTATSAVETIACTTFFTLLDLSLMCMKMLVSSLVKSLQAINKTSWHDTFLALWIAALRLVQRVRKFNQPLLRHLLSHCLDSCLINIYRRVLASQERDPIEGPVPGLDTRLCVLLSITSLVVADLIDEEENPIDELECGSTNHLKEQQNPGERRKDLVSCLQILGNYHSLLTPPQSVVSAANLAAAKAMMFVSGIDVPNGYFGCINVKDFPINCSGNMRHLIVEACIARNLLDKSAYFWPGYVNGQIKQFPSLMPSQVPGWSSFMRGAPLTPMMVNAMVATPASSLAELEKVFELAVSGSQDEKVSAATILCGASLVHGWNVQEHIAYFITRLLSPPVPADNVASDSHLIAYAPMLFVLLAGIAPVDCVQIFSLHGLVPQLAASLMTICEVFGSCIPNTSWTVSGEEITAHGVFSHAFTLLLKLWRFNHPPLDYGVGDVPPVGSQLTPEYLLLIRNSLLTSSGNVLKDRNKQRLSAVVTCAHGQVTPRELATGLKDLADFLPASLATIVSYFSAEVTRGVWKPAVMNGTDWPSPAANLSNVEEHIKKILAATGIDVPSLAAVSSPATLPLPLAAFLSLTITYKLDKVSQRFLNLAGPALESLAADCPWPCMPIVASLWAQKAKRWSDFLVFSASRTVFLHNSDAVAQLLRSCFTATLGLNSTTPLSRRGGVSALLGHGFGSHFNGGISPVAPGILYLRVYRSVRDVMFLAEEIVSLLMQSVREIANAGIWKETTEKLKKTKTGARYRPVSLAASTSKVKHAASLGATLLWLSGGQGLVQCLLKETLPSWFISVHRPEQEEVSERTVSVLRGYALAYFVMLCGAFAWGIDMLSSASKRRPGILRQHLDFLASALERKISLGCDLVIWRAYVSRFITLMVRCAPNWVVEMDKDLLIRLGKGLVHCNEDDLALALLTNGGVSTMGAAAKLIIETER
ncbi:hypothetical protein Cgig2_000868 [Carnegiea gigantea]|uniref:Mediator of RNA polymerase II transcription subunit 33A n=1 Tax=Carnegiea gigantea TaxID=171969 RepID=A0A9Q1K0C6_9CARY|nr:hypothetical protein Cgig2_000868 [Carnegiea gigantea]